MFTFVICLVVVGAALALAARIVLAEAPQPATGRRTRGRVPVQPVVDVDSISWVVRARSVVLLAALLALLGAFLALLVVLGGALALSALKNAVQ